MGRGQKLLQYAETLSGIMAHEFYSRQRQKYKFRVSKKFLDEDGVTNWFEYSINNTFSFEEIFNTTDGPQMIVLEGTYSIEFSFSDLQDATLFRLRF